MVGRRGLQAVRMVRADSLGGVPDPKFWDAREVPAPSVVPLAVESGSTPGFWRYLVPLTQSHALQAQRDSFKS